MSGVQSPTISNVAVADNVVVQGAINGTSVSAYSVIDQKVKTGVGDSNGGDKNQKPGMSFFGGIGNFLKHLFGF